MLQKRRPPDLHFVFLKADIPDDNIWIKGHFIFCCHLKKKEERKKRKPSWEATQLLFSYSLSTGTFMSGMSHGSAYKNS